MFEKLFKEKQVDTYVIAEIGGAFSTFEQAKALIEQAKNAGVDCVKIQTFQAETITSKNAVFDMEVISGVNQYEFFKKGEISEELHRQIIAYVRSQELDFFSTPSHTNDIDLLLNIGVEAFKIGADDANNLPLLRYAAKTKLPIFLSTGMCTMEEVKTAVNTMLEEGNDKIVIFHTVSSYPSYPEQLNLSVLNTFKSEFPGLKIGFSDHSLTPLASIIAAVMGADVIEKHFTLSKQDGNVDSILSATPDEMKYIVDSIKTARIMKGIPIKHPIETEIVNRKNNRKSIVAVSDIKAGECISYHNVDIKRPGTGIQPRYLEQIVGRMVNKNIKAEDVINWEDVR